MSGVRFIHNPNPLAQKLSAPGGKKIADAVADAQAVMDAMAPAGLDALDRAVAGIAAALAGHADPLTAATLETIYRQAADIHGAAALFGLGDMGEAAWSLCELIDAGGAVRTRRAAIVSHLDCLRLLRQGEAVPADQRRALLDGLQDLRLHGKQEPSVP